MVAILQKANLPIKTQLRLGVVGAFAAKASGVGLQLLIAITLARALGPHEYGRYSFAFSILTILSIPASLGFRQYLTKEVSVSISQTDYFRARYLIWMGFRSVIASSIILSFIVATISAIFGENYITAVSMLALPFLSLAHVICGGLGGLHRPVLAELNQNIFIPALLLLAVVVYVEKYNGLSAFNVIVFLILGAVAALSLSYILLWQSAPFSLRLFRSERIDWKQLTEIWPFSILTLLTVLSTHLDIVLLGLFRGDAEVGIYHAVAQISLVSAFLLIVVNVPLAPIVAKLHSKGDKQELQRVARLSAIIAFSGAAPIALLLILFGETIISVAYGDSYAIGALPLAILAIGQLVNAGSGSVATLLAMTGHQNRVVRGLSIAIGCTIVISALLIPYFGMIGAAIATAVSTMIWNILLAIEVIRQVRINPTILPSASLL